MWKVLQTFPTIGNISSLTDNVPGYCLVVSLTEIYVCIYILLRDKNPYKHLDAADPLPAAGVTSIIIVTIGTRETYSNLAYSYVTCGHSLTNVTPFHLSSLAQKDSSDEPRLSTTSPHRQALFFLQSAAVQTPHGNRSLHAYVCATHRPYW